MSKRRATIRPDLVGQHYLDTGFNKVYELLGCGAEPHAIMMSADGLDKLEKPISAFKNFVLLVPQKPRAKPIKEKPARKPRSDKNKPHRKSQPKESVSDNLTIHSPTGIGADTEYIVTIAGSRVASPETAGLRVAIIKALAEFGGEIPDCLNDDERKIIQGILGAEVSDPRD